MSVDKEFLKNAEDLFSFSGDDVSADLDEAGVDAGPGDVTTTTDEPSDVVDVSSPDITSDPDISMDSAADVSDTDARDSLIEQLRAQVLELTKATTGEVWPAQPQPNAEVSTPGQTPTATQQPKSGALEDLLKEVSYLSEEEIDSIIDDPQLINKALNRARQDMLGVIQSSLPTVVSNLIEQQMLVQRVVQSFYETNEDLRPYADFVRYKMGQIETANPNLTYGDIFAKTAEECRKGLGLKNPDDKQRDKSPGEKPAFTASKRTSTQRPVPKKDEIFDSNAKDLLDLIT